MSTQAILRMQVAGTIENNLPIYAKNTAKWAIRAAQASEEGSLYNLITARVFTAFMVEGTVDHLGRIMDKDWDVVPPATPESRKLKSKSRMEFRKKLKTVRTAIGLTNDDAAFQKLRDEILSPLFNFRDKFAHPKQEKSHFEEIVDSVDGYRAQADWDRALKVEMVSAEFELLEAHCQELLKHAITTLKSDGESWREFHRKYPHLGGDVDYVLGKLQIFWISLGSSIHSATTVANPADAMADQA